MGGPKPQQAKQSTRSTATAGPSEDDRFGRGLVAENLHAQIRGSGSAVGTRALVTIDKGTMHGVHPGMEGYVKSSQGMLAQLSILSVGLLDCQAIVEATPDQLRLYRGVVIAPPKMPEGKLDAAEPARIIAVAVESGRTLITIARGKTHGVTSKTTGRLYAENGREGETFTVAYTHAMRSFAHIAATPDQVRQFGSVKFDASSPASSGAAVQRRASGASSAGDVQAAAQAGVANASSQLPFLDTIQRAFGKHDISGVQAQIGGAAESASDALGARAYATGNKVAFASSPDLHTAAHEAAHVIQQRRGAVSFQGLGAADDEHERHADAVADAVVAGQSAEPLLDQLASGNATEAIQRKPADAEPTRRAPGDLRYSTIRRVLSALATTLGDAQASALDVLHEAKLYLGEARALVASFGVSIDREHRTHIARDIDMVSRALRTFVSRSPNPQGMPATLMQDVIEQARYLRTEMAMDEEPATEESSHRPQPTNTLDVVRSILEVVELEAITAYDRLAHGEDRHRILPKINGVLVPHLRFVSNAFSETDETRSAIQPHVQRASHAILKIRRWISGREASAILLEMIAPATGALDDLRHRLGLEPMIDLDSPQVSQRVHESEQAEDTVLGDAIRVFEGAIDASIHLFKLGIGRFETFAALKRPSPKRDNAIFKFLVTVALNVAAPGVGTFVSTCVASGMLSEKAGQLVGKLATKMLEDKVKAVVKQATDAVLSEESNQDVRERRLFAESVAAGYIAAKTEVKAAVSTLVKENRITAKEVLGMAANAALVASQTATYAYREAAHGFALYQAHKGFAAADERDAKTGAHKDADNPMAGYFDRNAYGHVRKEGMAGVGKLELVVTQTGDELNVSFKRFRIHGMNDDMAIAVIERAAYQLDRIGLPLEIEMRPPRWGMVNSVRLPIIAVDDKGNLRGSQYWEEITRALKDTFWTPPRDAKLIATPTAFWDSIRGATLPAGIARIERGG